MRTWPLRDWGDTDSAYLAGIFDSDGTLSIRKNRDRRKGGTRSGYFYSPTASLTWLDNQRSRKVFEEMLLKNYSGSITAFNHLGHPNRRPMARYITYSQNAKRLALDILPFLRLKKRQAELIIELAETQERNRKNSPKPVDWAIQDKLYDEMMQLKHRKDLGNQ